MFTNTLTAEYMYSPRNMQNFPKQLQTQLSQKDFSGFFVKFRKSTTSLEHFGQKDEPPSLSILEIIDSTGSGYLNV